MKLNMMIAALLVSGGAYAEDVSVHETCSGASELAEQIARVRYADIPMRDTMANVSGDFPKALVQDAYALPDYSSDKYQERAIVDFGNQVYSMCYERFSE